jgi:antitoxin (DNA-binding transcriptional repressor) of toxin-antitoxin stability system
MEIEEIGTLEAKTNLSALLNQVLEGKRFYLTRRGKRIAELGPVAPPARSRRAGFAKGTFTYVAPDFDAPLDDFADYR